MKRGVVVLLLFVAFVGLVHAAPEVGVDYIIDERLVGGTDCDSIDGGGYEEVGVFISRDASGSSTAAGNEYPNYYYCVKKAPFVLGEDREYVSDSYFYDLNGQVGCPEGDSEHRQGFFFDSSNGHRIGLCVYWEAAGDLINGITAVEIGSGTCGEDFVLDRGFGGSSSFSVVTEGDLNLYQIVHCSSTIVGAGVIGGGFYGEGSCVDSEANTAGERTDGAIGVDGRSVGLTFPNGNTPPEFDSENPLVVWKDFCSGPNDYVEYYCNVEGGWESQGAGCTAGDICGARGDNCMDPARSLGVSDSFEGCFDSEGTDELNPKEGRFVRGSVDVFSDEGMPGERYYDVCDGDRVIEYYCKSNAEGGWQDSKPVNCRFGCEDGACIETNPDGVCELSNARWVRENSGGEKINVDTGGDDKGFVIGWSSDSDKADGEDIWMAVDVDGTCNGKTANFTVMEDDFIFDDFVDFLNGVPGVALKWNPIWGGGAFGGIFEGKNLEYYFLVSVVEDGGEPVRSNIIIATEPPERVECEENDDGSVSGAFEDEQGVAVDKSNGCALEGETLLSYSCSSGYIAESSVDCIDGLVCAEDGDGKFGCLEEASARCIYFAEWRKEGTIEPPESVLGKRNGQSGEVVYLEAKVKSSCLDQVRDRSLLFDLRKKGDEPGIEGELIWTESADISSNGKVQVEVGVIDWKSTDEISGAKDANPVYYFYVKLNAEDEGERSRDLEILYKPEPKAEPPKDDGDICDWPIIGWLIQLIGFC